MKAIFRTLSMLLVASLVSTAALAQVTGANQHDSNIQAKISRQLDDKKFSQVHSSVEDGIVTLTGTVDTYQQKLDAGKKARKADKVAGVRNLIEVATSAPDAELQSKLDRKLYYDRIGYDNRFNFVTVDVKNGVATLEGETVSYIARDSAVAITSEMPGVKDVVNKIALAPTSGFDDRIRRQATRVLYRDPVLSRYASDPAAPIRILVNNGKLSLYGTVSCTMDKQVAGIRAGQVFGVFSVENNLQVVKGS